MGTGGRRGRGPGAAGAPPGGSVCSMGIVAVRGKLYQPELASNGFGSPRDRSGREDIETMAGTQPEIRTFLCRSDNIGVLIRDPATGACAAIDVPEAAPVLKVLDETGWTLTDILVTHRHLDHIEGIPDVKRRTGARVTAPRKAGAEIPDVDVTVAEGDLVRVGDLEAQVWETPGHCNDHVTYWFSGAGIVFAGDTLFTLGCGRVVEGRPESL